MFNITKNFQQALNTGQITVHYQPIMAAHTSRIIGAEALIRWLDQDQTPVMSPDQFIPYIEKDSNLMWETTKFVMQEAFNKLSGHQRVDEVSDFRININISPSDIIQEGFRSFINGQLEESGLSPANLGLEITERQSTEGLENEIAFKMQHLKEQGILVSMDDLGIGESTLPTFLSSSFFETAKLDGKFADHVQPATFGLLYTEAVIEQLQESGATILAEGIETEAQMHTLTELGVDKFQGYLIGKPMPFSDLMALLQEPQPFPPTQETAWIPEHIAA